MIPAPIEITKHAAERYCKRIDPTLTLGEAYAAIGVSAPAIRIAATFGCSTVIQPSGARLKLEGDRVVTVVTAYRLARRVGRNVRGRAE